MPETIHLTKHYIHIDSNDRDTIAYPSPTNYQIKLPSRYRNIWEARLVNINIKEFGSAQKNVFLRIDNLNHVAGTSKSTGVHFCFAKLPLYQSFSNTFYINSTNESIPPAIMQNPIATMDRLVISITDSNGIILPGGLPNEWGDHSMQIELTCGDYITNGGGSTISGHGRVLGGTR